MPTTRFTYSLLLKYETGLKRLFRDKLSSLFIPRKIRQPSLIFVSKTMNPHLDRPGVLNPQEILDRDKRSSLFVSSGGKSFISLSPVVSQDD